jgi:hypothetical protein
LLGLALWSGEQRGHRWLADKKDAVGKLVEPRRKSLQKPILPVRVMA